MQVSIALTIAAPPARAIVRPVGIAVGAVAAHVRLIVWCKSCNHSGPRPCHAGRATWLGDDRYRLGAVVAMYRMRCSGRGFRRDRRAAIKESPAVASPQDTILLKLQGLANCASAMKANTASGPYSINVKLGIVVPVCRVGELHRTIADHQPGNIVKLAADQNCHSARESPAVASRPEMLA